MGAEEILNLFKKLYSRVPEKKMMKTIVFACILAVAVAKDTVLSIDQDNHKHDQRGTPGDSVTGSYRFIAADGTEHLVTYIADDKGYRVIGDATEPEPEPTPEPTPTPAPAPAPAQRVAVQLVQLVQPVHLLPVQYQYAPLTYVRAVETGNFNVITSNVFDGQFRGLPIFLNKKKRSA